MCVVTPGRIMTYLRCSHVSDDAWCMLHVAGITSSITQMRKLRPVEVKYLVLGPTARYGRDWGWGCVSPSSSSSGYAECVKWPPHLWLWVCRERGPLRGCCLFLQHPTSPHTPTRLSLSSGPFLSLQRESFHLRAVSMEEKGGGRGTAMSDCPPSPWECQGTAGSPGLQGQSQRKLPSGASGRSSPSSRSRRHFKRRKALGFWRLTVGTGAPPGNSVTALTGLLFITPEIIIKHGVSSHLIYAQEKPSPLVLLTPRFTEEETSQRGYVGS